MNRLPLWLLLASLLSAPAFAASEDEAGDVSEVDKDSSGPLKDRVRPVSGHLFLMNGRFEASPGVGVSLRDAFWQKVSFGVALTYHFNEEIGLGLRAAYNLSLISGAAQICDPESGLCSEPLREELTTRNGQPANVAYGLMSFLTSLDLQWAPLYGKIALFSESVLNFNMYILAGPAFLLYGPTNTPTVGGNVGVGFRFFVNKWLTVRLELRDVIYYEEGVNLGGTQLNSVRNQLMTELGFSMFFPTVFRDEG